MHDEPQLPATAVRRNPFTAAPTVGITLDHVSFAYADGETVLDDVSLDDGARRKGGAGGRVRRRQIDLGAGFAGAVSGAIRAHSLYGDAEVSEIGWETVREHVGVVLQHPVLFNDSVRANLTLGREADDATLWQALDIAQLTDIIAALPHGLDTVVGRQGVRLSGGQRQRLAIARMIVANPRVVILDEATSALDTATERQLHQAMNGFLAGRTTLIIAHRLSAVSRRTAFWCLKTDAWWKTAITTD